MSTLTPLFEPRRLTGAALPPRLNDLAEPPAELFVSGELPRLPLVAIVGTRRPTAEGDQYAEYLAARLAAEGCAIVSGGAEGIDAAAHRGALRVGGLTVVVAAAGIGCPYPAQNSSLFHDVLRGGGCYISLFPADVAARRHHFFARNACLAALCHLLIVVEAGFRSGARNAAAHARQLGRPWFAVPWAPWQVGGAGCLAELQLGARVLARPGDALAALRAQLLHPIARAEALVRVPDPPSANSALEPAQASEHRESVAECGLRSAGKPGSVRQRVLEAIQGGALHADDVCARTGLPAAAVQRALLALELEKTLLVEPTGRFRVCK